MPRCPLRPTSLWLTLLAATVAHAESPAEATLKARGLERSKSTFVVATEAAALEKVGELKTAFGRLTAAREKLAAVDQNNQAIAVLTDQVAYLNQEKKAIGAQAQNMPRMPRGGRFLRQSNSQNVAALQQQEQLAINEVNAELAARKKMVPSPQARKDLEADIAKGRDEAVAAATEARKLVDEAHASYEALGKDESVKSALAEVKKTTTDAIKLGPSKDFHTAVGVLEKAEKLLNLKAPAEASKTHHKPVTKPRPRKPASASAPSPSGP